jgi:DNA-binding IclR family transcriptional regulator
LQKVELSVGDQTPIGHGLDRYVAILDVFAGIRGGELPSNGGMNAYGVTDLSRAVGVTKGTMSRYLRRMEEVGILIRLPDRRFTLSTRVYHWGQAATPSSDLRFLANPLLKELVNRLGETASLFVLQSNAAVCIDQVDGVHPVRLNAAVGRQLPVHTGASPRLLLAFAPEEDQRAVLDQAPFAALTPHTIVDGDSLERALEQAREDGYVVSIGESNEGAIGLAAPIRDARGHVIAALSIAGPMNRLEDERLDEALMAVRTAATRVSERLGFTRSTVGHLLHNEGAT